MTIFFRTLLILWAFFALFPVHAQRLDSTYVMETGTSINYPANWDVTEDRGLIVFSENTNRRVILMDYPIVEGVLNGMMDNMLRNAVAILAGQILENDIDRETIYEFEANGRPAAGYDLLETQLPGNIFAIEFSNGGVGILVVVNVDDDTAFSMLSSFDNDAPRSQNRSAGSRAAASDETGIYIFRSEGRVSTPAGWSIDARRAGNLTYVQLSTPDDAAQVKVFDLSETLADGTPLDTVLTAPTFRQLREMRLEISGEATTYNLGNREALRYPVQVDGEDGFAFVLRFSNRAIGVVIASGDLTVVAEDLALILGSFNHLGAALDYLD